MLTARKLCIESAGDLREKDLYAVFYTQSNKKLDYSELERK